jgi:hypothetical protein
MEHADPVAHAEVPTEWNGPARSGTLRRTLGAALLVGTTRGVT